MRSQSVSKYTTAIYISTAILVLAMWGFAAFVALPRLVASAYEGTSLQILNGLITGQDYQPVEQYLARAYRYARLGTMLLVVVLLALPVAYKFRHEVKRAAVRLFPDEPRAGILELVAVAVALGLIFGFAEAGAAWIRARAAGRLTLFSNPDRLWMAPLANAVAFALLTLLVFSFSGGRERRLGRRVIPTLCVTLGVVGILRTPRFGFHPAAAWILSLGVGMQLGGLLARRPGLWRGLCRASVPGAVLVALVPLLLYPASWRYGGDPETGPTAPSSTPNVLLLVLDTVRGESLGFGGYERPTTPNLDRLARRGVVFERAVAPSPWTLPSHATLFTGLYPHDLGVRWNRSLSGEVPTLAEAFGALGYTRGGFVGNTTNAGPGTGLRRGFDHYVDYRRSFGTWVTSAFVTRRLTEEIWPRLPTRWKTIDRKYAPHVNSELLDWLDGLEGEPFFGFINYYDAHKPYEGHPEFMRRFDQDSRSTILTADGREVPARGAPARAIDAYDSAIALIDQAIDELLGELEARGLLENTLVVLTSDHGEQLGDRGLEDHGNSLYPQLLFVPLLLYWPGRIPEGVRVQETVSLRDLPATLLTLAGGEASPLPGRSLAGLWAPSAPPVERLAFAELEPRPHGGFEAGPNRLGWMRAVVDGSFQYIRNGDGREELLDLEANTRGRRDLVDTELGRNELPRFRALVDRFWAEAPMERRSLASHRP